MYACMDEFVRLIIEWICLVGWIILIVIVIVVVSW